MARLVDHLLDPLVLVWLSLIGFMAFSLWKRRKKSAIIHGLLVLLVFIIGSTPLTSSLIASLEKPFYRETFEDLPKCDAVVVLGGAFNQHGGQEEPLGFDVGPSADRFLTGIEMVKREKIPNLVFGGGSHGDKDDRKSEGEAQAAWVKQWQLVDARVYHLGICANTRDEAVRVLELAGHMNWKRVMLVTSALHMARASAVFRTTGVDVVPVACDFLSYPPRGGFTVRWRFFPSSDRFFKTKAYLHEQVGWLYYRTRGWIKPAQQ